MTLGTLFKVLSTVPCALFTVFDFLNYWLLVNAYKSY
jgi:hypothetical protein